MSPEYDRRHPRMCEACELGEHWRCGMQTWCECDDPRDGDPEAFFYPEPWDMEES